MIFKSLRVVSSHDSLCQSFFFFFLLCKSGLFHEISDTCIVYYNNENKSFSQYLGHCHSHSILKTRKKILVIVVKIFMKIQVRYT